MQRLRQFRAVGGPCLALVFMTFWAKTGVASVQSGCVRGQRVSSSALKAQMTHYVPLYLGLYRHLHIEGRVRLLVAVNENGIIDCAEVVSGNPMVTGAALSAAQRWRFDPFLFDGQRRRVQSVVTIVYSLHDEQQRSDLQ